MRRYAAFGVGLLLATGTAAVGAADIPPDQARAHIIPVDDLRPRSRPATAWTGNRLFVFGGSFGGRRLSHAENYVATDGAIVDPGTGIAHRLPMAPFHPRLEAPVAAAVGRRVVVLGVSCDAVADVEEGYGCRKPAPYAAAEYDVGADRWRSLRLPSELRDTYRGVTEVVGTTSAGHVVFLLGSHGIRVGEPDTRAFWTYSPKRTQWKKLPSPGVPIEDACLVGNSVAVLRTRYENDGVVADTDPTPNSASADDSFVEPSLALYDLGNDGPWRTTPASPTLRTGDQPPRLDCSDDAVAFVDSVFSMRNFEVYDVATATWRVPARLQPPNEERFSAHEVWVRDELVFIPSDAQTGAPAGAYDRSTDSWRTIAEVPSFGGETIWTGSALVGYAPPHNDGVGGRTPAGVYRYPL